MKRQTPLPSVWPRIWLLSDARNDAALEAALLRLPRGSGLIFRHAHLPAGARRARFFALLRGARRRGHVVALAGPPALARAWGAAATYGAHSSPRRASLPWLATVHSLAEIGRARRLQASGTLAHAVSGKPDRIDGWAAIDGLSDKSAERDPPLRA
jgi:thiamine-phosphate pyrophosphorylase